MPEGAETSPQLILKQKIDKFKASPIGSQSKLPLGCLKPSQPNDGNLPNMSGQRITPIQACYESNDKDGKDGTALILNGNHRYYFELDKCHGDILHEVDVEKKPNPYIDY